MHKPKQLTKPKTSWMPNLSFDQNKLYGSHMRMRVGVVSCNLQRSLDGKSHPSSGFNGVPREISNSPSMNRNKHPTYRRRHQIIRNDIVQSHFDNGNTRVIIKAMQQNHSSIMKFRWSSPLKCHSDRCQLKNLSHLTFSKRQTFLDDYHTAVHNNPHSMSIVISQSSFGILLEFVSFEKFCDFTKNTRKIQRNIF